MLKLVKACGGRRENQFPQTMQIYALI